MRQQSTTDKTTQNGFEGIKRSEEEEKKTKNSQLVVLHDLRRSHFWD
jgi:hypothetical protein